MASQKDETIQYNHKHHGHQLIASTNINGGVSIASFASGVGLPVDIALSGTSLLFSYATVITRKSLK